MGIETLDGFRDSVNLALGDKSQFNERLDRWINNGLEELFVILDIEGRRTCAQLTTTPDEDKYPLPINLIATLVMTDRTNKRRLLKTPIENFERLDAAAKGQPKVWARVDRDVFFHPIPSGAFLIQQFYIKRPDRMALGEDVSELISAYDRVIHLLAVRNAFIDLGEFDKATFLFQTATNMVRAIPTEEWLEGQVPAMGVEIARSAEDLTKAPSTLVGRGVRLR